LPGSPVCWLRATAAQVGLAGRWYLLTLVEDVTRRRRAQQQLVRSALHDEVTGLANRVLLADRMEAALDRSAHNGLPVGVLHIDLSDAERFATDRMLTEVADRLSPLLRSGDSAGRVGADRFMVIAGDVDAVALADLTGRVHQALAEPLHLDLTGTPARLTAVVGSCLARPGDNLVSVLQRAQAAACVPPGVQAAPAEGPS
jgi:diguanylate cyclase (GGDEF)-like protein